MAKLVYVVGLGPGDARFMTAQARQVLQACDVLCGYTVYIDLIRPLYPEKPVYTTGMTQEIDRCRWALQTAQTGRTVALVCSGDAGVYGMAAPLLESSEDYDDVAIEIIPGLTAALSGAAVLGAPLGHDFCGISLSDRLTPWAVIEKRLACAAHVSLAFFALCPYLQSINAGINIQRHIASCCSYIAHLLGLLECQFAVSVIGMKGYCLYLRGKGISKLHIHIICEPNSQLFLASAHVFVHHRARRNSESQQQSEHGNGCYVQDRLKVSHISSI